MFESYKPFPVRRFYEYQISPNTLLYKGLDRDIVYKIKVNNHVCRHISS